jgi:hypothetical protein
MSHWLDEFKLSGKQTKSADGKILGNIREIENNYILTENESKFYVPRYLIEKYDGNTLWFKIDEEEAKNKFMLATSPATEPF